MILQFQCFGSALLRAVLFFRSAHFANVKYPAYCDNDEVCQRVSSKIHQAKNTHRFELLTIKLNRSMIVIGTFNKVPESFYVVRDLHLKN